MRHLEDLRTHLAPALPHVTEVIAVRGHGPYLVDASGRRYLDFTSGIGVANTGHCHPRVVRAIQAQAERLLHGQATIVYHEPMLRLMDELLGLVPAGLEAFFFANSGAEAVEASVKLARRATGRPNLVVFRGAFHGRTIGALSLTTSKALYRTGYQPLMPGVHIAPYPYAFAWGESDDAALARCLRELRALFETQTAPEDTAAILVEPVLGEGGYVVPPAGFLTALRALCDDLNILLIADEVQTGFGRTGRFFAVEHAGVAPDILVMAKGIASGLPLGAIAARADLAARWPRGAHGSTFGGNAVTCAAAVATIEALREEGLVEHARRMGADLLARLGALQQRYPVIADVRGLGLMIGTEFRGSGSESPGQTAKAVQRHCLDAGLLLLTCGPRDQVIRWIPPLVVTDAEVDAAVRTFSDALERHRG